MCFPKVPTPKPAPPPPPPPEVLPPTKPLPEPKSLVDDINPKVRENQNRKADQESGRGTEQLRIPLKPAVNTGGASGGASQ